MNHKWIMAVFVTSFLLVWGGIFLHSFLAYEIMDIDRDVERSLEFVAQNLVTFGGLLLSTVSAVGAFFVEDKYFRVGLLLFSALTAAYILVP